MISDEQGKGLVRLARNAVQFYLYDSTVIMPPDGIELEAGVFVTLNYLTRSNEEHLRGCIGFPLPYKNLPRAVVDAAIAAATADPRFPPVDPTELSRVLFEVSILTPPIELFEKLPALRDSIKIGRDGLLLKWKYGSGLLLPQVPVELKWGVDEFLSNLCYKSGAPPDALFDPSSKLFKFQALVFKETTPSGPITKMDF